MSIQKRCRYCAVWQSPANFYAGRHMCKECRKPFVAAAQVAYKARKAEEVAALDSRDYVPPIGWLDMGEPDRGVALVASVGNRIVLPAYEWRAAA